MIQEIPSSGSVVITVATNPEKNTVTPRAVLFVEEEVNKMPVLKLMVLPAWIPRRIEPTTPARSRTTNAIRNAEARERIRSNLSVRAFIAASLCDDGSCLILADARRNR
jgi:hypothetical protein